MLIGLNPEIFSPAYHFQIDGHSVCCFSRDVLVTIMTRLQAGLSGVRIPAGARDFLAATHPAMYSHVPGFYPVCGAAEASSLPLDCISC
jgi:hypothetical protein